MIKNWIKRNFSNLLYARQTGRSQKLATEQWLASLFPKGIKKLSDASYDVFTYHGEDGIILYLISELKNVPQTFVDIGSGDGIKSNCANLAVHYNWKGVFIDQNEKQLAIGKNFYQRMFRGKQALSFCQATVTKENINELIRQAGLQGEIGLLSIDIDGNDYWIWQALEIIQPRILVIEAKVEFGNRDVIVPYGPANHHAADKAYNGASVEAFRKLGIQKGFKLVGANKQGYNLFFVRNDEHLPAVTSDSILDSPETKASFYPESFFEQHTFVVL